MGDGSQDLGQGTSGKAKCTVAIAFGVFAKVQMLSSDPTNSFAARSRRREVGHEGVKMAKWKEFDVSYRFVQGVFGGGFDKAIASNVRVTRETERILVAEKHEDGSKTKVGDHEDILRSLRLQRCLLV
jgi:hypothetical protein